MVSEVPLLVKVAVSVCPLKPVSVDEIDPPFEWKRSIFGSKFASGVTVTVSVMPDWTMILKKSSFDGQRTNSVELPAVTVVELANESFGSELSSAHVNAATWTVPSDVLQL